jgi:hypothetical protein
LQAVLKRVKVSEVREEKIFGDLKGKKFVNKKGAKISCCFFIQKFGLFFSGFKKDFRKN